MRGGPKTERNVVYARVGVSMELIDLLIHHGSQRPTAGGYIQTNCPVPYRPSLESLEIWSDCKWNPPAAVLYDQNGKERGVCLCRRFYRIALCRMQGPRAELTTRENPNRAGKPCKSGAVVSVDHLLPFFRKTRVVYLLQCCNRGNPSCVLVGEHVPLACTVSPKSWKGG